MFALVLPELRFCDVGCTNVSYCIVMTSCVLNGDETFEHQDKLTIMSFCCMYLNIMPETLPRNGILILPILKHITSAGQTVSTASEVSVVHCSVSLAYTV